MRVVVVGLGAMGSNHARVVAAHPVAQLAGVCDTDAAVAQATGERYGVPWSTAWDGSIACDAVIVATPTAGHPALVAELLDAGLPTLVEKPVAEDPVDVAALVERSRAAGVALMCGFVERYNPAVQTAIEVLDGPPVHVVALRHSPATPRATASVVHDLLIHDLDLALRIMGTPATSVAATAWRSPVGIAEVADATLGFAGGLATISASRIGHRKVRALQITTASEQIEVDMLRHDVTVYRHRSHEQLDGFGPTYRAESVIDIPFVRHAGEPLAQQLDAFVALVQGEADVEAERTSILEPHRIAAEIEALLP